MRRRRQNRIQRFKRHYWPIYFCTTNLIFDRHVISILAPRYVLHVLVLCSQCFVTKFTPLSFSSISSAFPTWMLKEMSCIESSSGRISGNTLRPALIAGCLFAWFEEHPLAFSYKDNPVLDEISAEKYQIQSVSDEMPERHPVEGSNRWNNIFTSISSAISTWILMEMSCTRCSSTRISGNTCTLRPALTAGC